MFTSSNFMMTSSLDIASNTTITTPKFLKKIGAKIQGHGVLQLLLKDDSVVASLSKSYKSFPLDLPLQKYWRINPCYSS